MWNTLSTTNPLFVFGHCLWSNGLSIVYFSSSYTCSENRRIVLNTIATLLYTSCDVEYLVQSSRPLFLLGYPEHLLLLPLFKKTTVNIHYYWNHYSTSCDVEYLDQSSHRLFLLAHPELRQLLHLLTKLYVTLRYNSIHLYWLTFASCVLERRRNIAQPRGRSRGRRRWALVFGDFVAFKIAVFWRRAQAIFFFCTKKHVTCPTKTCSK